MRIVIDMQGAQGENRLRGIGRYTLAITKAIIRNCSKHEVILALNGLFPESIELIRADFNGMLAQKNIRVWYALDPTSSLNTDNDWYRSVAVVVREAFLTTLEPDVVFIPSLFEGLVDNAVISIGQINCHFPTAVTLHDLIPLIYRDSYLIKPAVEVWYEKQLGHLRRADMVIAISESSRQEAIKYLGFPSKLVVNASEGAEAHFIAQKLSTEYEADIRAKYGLVRPFVMYGGGIDYRKNVEGLVRAYAALSETIRAQHQLVIVCAIQPQDKTRLSDLSKKSGLDNGDVVFTGFVSEEDLIALYSLCKLFVFPSWHEGFGLPVLEAMSCGRAVIGSNTSSVPEVIGREDALFDPRNDAAITAKMTQVLTDDRFRSDLEEHGLEQAKKFSWDKSAVCILEAFEKLYAKNQDQKFIQTQSLRINYRPKLAYVSPLPPERSGISDYSAELLPELARYYDIDVIVAQDSVSTSWIIANCQIRDEMWFRENAKRYERVLYHFGNSHFHQHMFSLLEDIPGVVVLHDFFLSGIVAHMDIHGSTPNGWVNELYKSHGYRSVQERFQVNDTADVVWKYPCNLSVLSGAKGVIVHSENSVRLAKHWYVENDSATNWAVIPLLRVPGFDYDRIKARDILKLNADDFVVCSFGLLGPGKLNHRLLDSWINSKLAKDKQCVLIFVGENNDGEYAQGILRTIRQSGLSSRIRITGWSDTAIFRHYLAAADIGVQLRTRSRGETSAAVLDCMNYALATIVNTNGSMADLDDSAVIKLTDEFSNEQLTYAMESLWQDESSRKKLGARAREIIIEQHAPRHCADQYFVAIERFFDKTVADVQSLTSALAQLDVTSASPEEISSLAEAVTQSIAPAISPRQLLVDISELVQRDSKSGIQRVVRSILSELLSNPPEGLHVEPVYATMESGYRYARRFTLNYLNCPPDALQDDLIEYRAGDVFLGLDLQPQVVPVHKDFYQQMRRKGVQVQFIVHDLLAVRKPEWFFPNSAEIYIPWLKTITQADGAICVSKATADDLQQWIGEANILTARPFRISVSHSGADIKSSSPSYGIPRSSKVVMNSINDRISFLMVGTIEPRKGYAQTLAAFEQLWADGVDVNLLIVGKQGWMVEALIDSLRRHPEKGKRLFWLEGISDEYLEKIYANSTCLIAASEGEGFGLPLIEAAQHNMPIIARDIPVFREVAAEHAYYFTNTNDASVLSEAIRQWLKLHDSGKHQTTHNMPLLSWKESVLQLNQILL